MSEAGYRVLEELLGSRVPSEARTQDAIAVDELLSERLVTREKGHLEVTKRGELAYRMHDFFYTHF